MGDRLASGSSEPLHSIVVNTLHLKCYAGANSTDTSSRRPRPLIVEDGDELPGPLLSEEAHAHHASRCATHSRCRGGTLLHRLCRPGNHCPDSSRLSLESFAQ